MCKIKTWFKDTSFYYWIVLVVWPSIKDAIPVSKARDKIMGILVAAIVSLILVFWGITFQIQDLRLNLVAFFVWLGLIFLLRLIANIFYLPAKINKKQVEVIKKLSPRNEKIIIENFDYYDEFSPFERKTGITIHNENKIPFMDVVIELVETTWRKLDSITEGIGVSPDNSRFENWANAGKYSVGAKDKETIYFHQIENKNAVALLKNRKGLFEYKDNNFSDEGKAIGFIDIIFEIRGYVGNDFFEKRYAQSLDYRSTRIMMNPDDVISTIETEKLFVLENKKPLVTDA